MIYFIGGLVLAEKKAIKFFFYSGIFLPSEPEKAEEKNISRFEIVVFTMCDNADIYAPFVYIYYTEKTSSC